MNPLYKKLYSAKITIQDDDDHVPRYTIDNNRITIYNFTCADEHGYTDKTNFIELAPTNETYNLLGKKSRKIFLDKKPLEIKEEREIIINAIKTALVETNCASEMDNIYILKDLSILVTTDDWSDYHELL